MAECMSLQGTVPQAQVKLEFVVTSYEVTRIASAELTISSSDIVNNRVWRLRMRNAVRRL